MLPEELARSERRAELEVLVICSRVTLVPEDESRLADALGEELDWTYLLRAATVHGVLPLLHRHVASGSAGPLPAAVQASLRQRQATATRTALLRTAALVEALRALADSEIVAVPFKGPLLTQGLYGDLGLRPFCDVDILLHPGHLEGAVARLAALGWTVVPGQGAVGARLRCAWVSDLLLARGGLLIELHWRLTQPYFGVADTLADIEEELVPAEIGGLGVRTLSPTRLLFYLCVHGATHRWPRLEWICDVAEMLRRERALDWGQIRRLAHRDGALRMIGLGLFLAHDLLGAPLPPEAAELAAGRGVRRLAHAVYRHLPDENPDPSPGLKLVPFHLAMRERIGDRARYGLSVLFAPSPLDLEALRLPPRLYPLYRLIRPFRLVTAHFRRPRRAS